MSIIKKKMLMFVISNCACTHRKSFGTYWHILKKALSFMYSRCTDISLFFRYTQELFKKGYSKDLEDEDIYEVIRSCSSQRCGNKLEKQWAYENEQDTPASIYKLMLHRYGLRYIFLGCVDLVVKVSNR